jgi:hypothetical protein
VAGVIARLTLTRGQATIRERNWEKYDWGSGPEVKDRLYQASFPQYTDPDVPDPGMPAPLFCGAVSFLLFVAPGAACPLSAFSTFPHSLWESSGLEESKSACAGSRRPRAQSLSGRHDLPR